jgi:hypothetical protein
MDARVMWSIVIALAVIIVVLGVILFAVPAPAHAPTIATTTTPASTDSSEEPLHTRVHVATPQPNTVVGKTFTISGEAPGQWYFEASFPVQIKDKDGNTRASIPARAQGDWMTTAQVPFTATLTVADYTGPATLVLLRDNPSGLPENDDALEVPIVIQ